MRRLTPRRIWLGVALAAAGASAALPSHAADEPPAVDLRLDAVDPGWVSSGASVDLTASLHAATEDVPDATDLRVTLSTTEPVGSRDEVEAWLAQGAGGARTRQDVQTPSAPGDRPVDLSLTLDAPTVDRPMVVPVIVAVSGEVDGERRVIDLQRTVVPVLPSLGAEAPRTGSTRLGWVVQVAADLSAQQFASDEQERRAAWSDAVSASPSVAAATAVAEHVTRAVDPALVPHLTEEQAEGVLQDLQGSVWRTPRYGLRPVVLREGEDDLWRQATSSTEGLAAPLLVDLSSSTGRPASDDAQLGRLLDSSAGPTVVLAPAGFRGEDVATGGEAGDDPGNWWSGHRVGWVDQTISHHLTTQSGTPGDEAGVAVPAQAMLGLSLVPGDEAAAAGADAPGGRQNLVVAPDPMQVDATALERAVRAAQDAPWLDSMPASELVGCVADGCGESPGDGTAQWPAVEPPIESLARSRDLPAVQRDAADLAPVVTDTPRQLLQDLPVSQLSDRWTSEEDREQALDQTARTLRTLLRALSVDDSSVNLLADSAELRATIANDSGLSFENLRVVVSPGNHRITVEQPESSLGLGPRGRASTAFTARAHAAGQVPLRVIVTTPDGDRVLARGEVAVNARPADNWWYAGLGIVTALLIGFGAWRTVRQARGHGAATDDQQDASDATPPRPRDSGDPL